MADELGALDDVVVRHQASVEAVDLGPWLVLANDVGTVAALEDHGQMLWPLLDGSASLGELADDVADVFGAPRGTVLDDLHRFANDLLSQGFVVGPGVPPQPEPTDHLPPPRNSCNCSIPDVTWRSSCTIGVGPHVIRIRSNLDEIDDAVRAMFPTAVADDVDAPANLSLVHRGPVPGSSSPTLELYHGLQLAGRSPSSARVRQLLLEHLTALSEVGSGWLVLDATPAGGPDGVVLVGSQLSSLSFLVPALHRRGLAVGPAVTAVDPATGEVVIGSAGVDTDPEGVARFDGLCDWTDDRPEPLAPGRYPIRGLALVEEPAPTVTDAGDQGAAERVELLRQALPVVTALPAVGTRAAIDHLMVLADRVEIRPPGPPGLADWAMGRLDGSAT